MVFCIDVVLELQKWHKKIKFNKTEWQKLRAPGSGEKVLPEWKKI